MYMYYVVIILYNCTSTIDGGVPMEVYVIKLLMELLGQMGN